MLTLLDQLPPGFLETTPKALHHILPGPTLIHLPGKDSKRLFISILQHGNEDVGLLAIQALLKKYITRELPRSLSIFIGNVAAAHAGVRHLDGQPDYNRVWPGGPPGNTPEHKMMQQIVDTMQRQPLFASVDLHNNMGFNPHYACVNRLDPAFLQLATLYSRTVVYFTYPKGVQSMAFAKLCPATTIECGQSGHAPGVSHATEFLDACLHLSSMPKSPVAPQDLDLFHTVAIVKVPDNASLGIRNDNADIVLIDGLEQLNFRELEKGTEIATTNMNNPQTLLVWNSAGEEVSEQYLSIENGKIQLKKTVMPSMLTINEKAIRQDCLGYFMERYT